MVLKRSASSPAALGHHDLYPVWAEPEPRNGGELDIWSTVKGSITTHADMMLRVVVGDVACLHIALQKPDNPLQAVHIHAVCHLTLLTVAVLASLYYLQSVVLPIILAAGVAVLLEPFVFILVDSWVRLVTPKRHRPSFHGVLTQTDASGDFQIGVGVSTPVSPAVGSAQRRTSPTDALVTQLRVGDRMFSSAVQRVWCVFVVGLVIACLFSSFGLLGLWVIASVQSLDWKKYLSSPRFALFRDLLAEQGIDFDNAFKEVAIWVIQAIGIELVDSTMTALSNFLIFILFLGFLLFDSASARTVSVEPWKPLQQRIMAQVEEIVHFAAQTQRQSGEFQRSRSELTVQDITVDSTKTLLGKLRTQMKTYVQSKFWLSVVKAIIIGGVFASLDIDLWIIWTLLTFVFNFVPLGSAISTFAPIPFVFLDPSKNWIDVGVCVFLPLLVHNFVGNVVEPRVFATTLALHPVTVLLSLTFWTALWGVLGAVVCVPLTAVIRITLVHVKDHPYVTPVLGLLEGTIAFTKDADAGSVDAIPPSEVILLAARVAADVSDGADDVTQCDDKDTALLREGLRARGRSVRPRDPSSEFSSKSSQSMSPRAISPCVILPQREGL